MFSLYWVSLSTALPAVTWILPGDCSRPWCNMEAPTEMNFNFCFIVRLNYQTRQCDMGVCGSTVHGQSGLKDMMTQDAGVWPVTAFALDLTCSLFTCTNCLVLPWFPLFRSEFLLSWAVIQACPLFLSFFFFSYLLGVREGAVLSYLSVLSLLALC